MSFEIFIDGLKILWTTSFESEPEGESETTTTHSGPIIDPPESDTYNITIERATNYESIHEQEVLRIIEKSRDNPVTIVAVKKTPRGGMRLSYSNCKLSTKPSYSVDENGKLEISMEYIGENETIEILEGEA